MDALQKKRLQENFTLVVDSLDVRDVVNSLYQRDVLSLDEVQELGAEAVGRQRKQRVVELIGLLQTRPTGYDAFKEALDDAGAYNHVLAGLIATEESQRRQNAGEVRVGCDRADCGSGEPSRRSQLSIQVAASNALDENDASRPSSLRGDFTTTDYSLTSDKVPVQCSDSSSMTLLFQSDAFDDMPQSRNANGYRGAVVGSYGTTNAGLGRVNRACLVDMYVRERRKPSYSFDYDADSENNGSDSAPETELQTASRYEIVIERLPRANSFVKARDQRFLARVFDDLSSHINDGHHDTFHGYRINLLVAFPNDSDLKFVLSYLTASSHLWKNEFTETDRAADEALAVVPKTSRPSRALVEILSSRCWMYFQQKRFNKLRSVLDQALQTIHQDPVDTVGKAAGWIFVDKARLNMAMMQGNDLDRIQRLRAEGIKCLEEALGHFKKDDSKDGPFGYGFTGTMLASLLLACGDKLTTLRVEPTNEDIIRARDILTEVEDGASGLPDILKVHVHLAKCDYFIRKGFQYKERAESEAREGLELATKHSMKDLAEFAQLRVDFLQTHIPFDRESGAYQFAEDPTSENISQHRKSRRRGAGFVTSQDLLVLGLALLILLAVFVASYFDLLLAFLTTGKCYMADS